MTKNTEMAINEPLKKLKTEFWRDTFFRIASYQANRLVISCLVAAVRWVCESLPPGTLMAAAVKPSPSFNTIIVMLLSLRLG
jgi:hypothetical protein